MHSHVERGNDGILVFRHPTHPPRFLHFLVTQRTAENTLRAAEFYGFPLRLSARSLRNSALQKISFRVDN